MRKRPSAGRASGLRILATVTLNSNQLRSHLEPIAALESVESITLVTDAGGVPLDKLIVVVPRPWLVRVAGRAGAKFLTCLWLALRRRPDWVMGFTAVPHGVTARIVGALTGARSIYQMIGGAREWVGGGWSSENAVLGRLPRPVPWLERLLIRLVGGCSRIVTMGPGGRRDLIERGVVPERIAIVPPAIHLQAPARRRADDARRYDVLSVSRLVPNKRVEDILDALAIMRGRGRQPRLALVGAGPHEDALRRRVQELNLAENVDFLGFRDELVPLYEDARVFVLASLSEGLPIAMLEAMTLGVPPVVSSVGEISELIRNGENGYTFDVGDVSTLARLLERVLDDHRLRERIGRAAARDAPALASVDRVSELYAALLDVPRR